MDKSRMYKVYPTEYVRGFVPTYCESEDDAWQEQMNMEQQTGVEWAIEFPEWAKMKEKAMNALSDLLEWGNLSEQAANDLQHTIVMIYKYWNNNN